MLTLSWLVSALSVICNQSTIFFVYKAILYFSVFTYDLPFADAYAFWINSANF